MSADSINIITIDFPDPYRTELVDDHFDPLAVRSSQNLLHLRPDHELSKYQLQLNESYYLPIQNNIQTLSSKGVERGDDPYGLLFLPDLSSDDCKDSEKQHIPTNTTRLAQLPSDAGYALIAVAPWFSAKCMREYFEAARTKPVKAFIVYQPDNGTVTPPQTNDVSWAMGDGGQWQFANQFPTYAIPGANGFAISQQMGLYSGNISTVPFGDSLSQQFNRTDYIRLWAKVNADSGTQLPSLWVFLVIVLGLLVVVIGCTSGCMHFIQRRRRHALRQRVVRGEIDLEALGVKRLNVPEDYLHKLPVYPYLGEPGDGKKIPNHPSTDATNAVEAETGSKPSPLNRHSSAPTVPSTTRASTIFSQPTCPICLDDFEPNESQVRELPCRHIFHVECIDPFLLNNSSLCPICKQSVLPPGYCPPKITNAMVRRERMISRRRARTASTQAHAPENNVARLPGAYDSIRMHVGGGRRIFSAPTRTPARPADIEMTPASIAPFATQPATGASDVIAVPAPTHSNGADSVVEPPATQPAQRAEWARQRALALLGTQDVPAHLEEEERPRSKFKRALRKIFP